MESKRRQYPEFLIHKAIAEYCVKTFIEGKSLWHTTENSNGRGGIQARREQAKLKVLGVKPGFPDGMVIYDSAKILFIEIKSATGIIQENQIAMHMLLRVMGFPVEVVRSLNEFVEIIKKYKVPSKDKDSL